MRWLLWIVDGFPYFLPLVGFIVGLTTVGPPPRRRHGRQDVRGASSGHGLTHRRARAHSASAAGRLRGHLGCAAARPDRHHDRVGPRRRPQLRPAGPAPHRRRRSRRRRAPTPRSGTRHAAPTSSGTPPRGRGCSGTRARQGLVPHPGSVGRRQVSHVIDPEGTPYAPEGLPRKDAIGADGFFAVDLRAGRVVDVEPVPRGPQAGVEAHGRLRAGRRRSCARARRSPTTRPIS